MTTDHDDLILQAFVCPRYLCDGVEAVLVIASERCLNIELDSDRNAGLRKASKSVVMLCKNHSVRNVDCVLAQMRLS